MSFPKALVLFLVCSSAQAEYKEQLKHETYDVILRQGQGLFSATKAASPFARDGKDFVGYTQSKINWSFNSQGNAAGCRLTNVIVTMNTTITLPLLRGGSSAKQNEFAIFRSALEKHENGHLQLNQAVARQLERQLLSLPEKPGCEQLHAEADAIGEAWMKTLADVNRKYDEKTQHGITQGAVLSD